MQDATFTPGSLVTLRDREWVIETCDIEGCLALRPIGGTDGDIQIVMPELETSELKGATFPLPDITNPGAYDSALLLRDSLRLRLTSGAGPFRCLGHIAVEPRPYQLVPLLMALKMNVIRLLIADDVGIGKTIEAALIVKELLERGEIKKFVVLCPPHLVQQWVSELDEHFNIPAIGVTARSINSLEKEVPQSERFFEHYPASVISLDYIKSDAHASWFKTHIDDAMIVVDEAHTCCAGGGKQLRFNLLRDLASNTERNMLLLTATPHSGNENAFSNLISLLKQDFSTLDSLGTQETSEKKQLREELGLHLVQRRRKDILAYKGTNAFPVRMTSEIKYTLTGEWGDLFESVRKYCVDLSRKAEKEMGNKGKMMWYATLALLRCVSSSPAAARSALTTRLATIQDKNTAASQHDILSDEELLDESLIEVYDGIGEDSYITDQMIEPLFENTQELTALIQKAENLYGKEGDPKLQCLVRHVKENYENEKNEKKEYRPVIFCKYIATAHYVCEQLKKEFPQSAITYVTGEMTNLERSAIVEETRQLHHPVLVATDCLSEGINLQEGFNAVIHYDLAWNPTRHEQREGRVDRFGQKCAKVWTTMLYGEDNPVDGFILNVILRKAESIKNELGVHVPIPDDDRSVRKALVQAALLKGRVKDPQSHYLDFGDEETNAIIRGAQLQWKDAEEKAKKNRTIFAQNALKPEEVYPEWEKTREALGDSDSVEKFCLLALTRLNAGFKKCCDNGYEINLSTLPKEVTENITSVKKKNTFIKASFHYPPEQGYTFIHRSHTFVRSLADYFFENALSDMSVTIAKRSGTYKMNSINTITTVYLLRLRYQITTEYRNTVNALMAEETIAVGIEGRSNPRIIEGEDVIQLLDCKPDANMSAEASVRELSKSLEYYGNKKNIFSSIAGQRAAKLEADHSSVRHASIIKAGKIKVTACEPLDLIGVYVLTPAAAL